MRTAAPPLGLTARSSHLESRRFLIRFSLLIVGFYLVLAWNPINDHVVVPFTEVVAGASAKLLRLLGEQVSAHGTTIHSPGFGVDVKNGCNGIEAVMLLASAIVAYPESWRKRLAGLATGVAIVELLNLVRVTSLFWIGAHRPALFSTLHVAVWQSAIILLSVATFLIWSRRVTRQGATAHR